MKRLLFILLAGITIGFTLISVILLVAFTGNISNVYQVDQMTATSSTPVAIAVNLGLLLLFGVQHSVMAREGFKTLVRKWIPFGLERMIYILLTNLVLVLIVICWQPIPVLIWEIKLTWLNTLVYTIFFLAWFLVLSSPALTSLNDFLGIRQLASQFLNKQYIPLSFSHPLLYKFIRHPMYLGFLIAFFASPVMTLSHLIFSVGMAIYIVIGMRYEERDLTSHFGDTYVEYKKSTPALFPKGIPKD